MSTLTEIEIATYPRHEEECSTWNTKARERPNKRAQKPNKALTGRGRARDLPNMAISDPAAEFSLWFRALTMERILD